MFSRSSVSEASSVRSPSASRQALQFFGLATISLTTAVLLLLLFRQGLGRALNGSESIFVPAFLVSSLLLAIGSYLLHSAVGYVKRERQREFRTRLLWSLGVGTLFMGVQSYALWTLLPLIRPRHVDLANVAGFVALLATLHALHFLVAVLFVILILTRTWGDRYDHEYYWGVRACAWFWHFLGIVWLAILGVMLLGSLWRVWILRWFDQAIEQPGQLGSEQLQAVPGYATDRDELLRILGFFLDFIQNY